DTKREPLTGCERANEIGQLLHEVVDRLLLEVRARKAGERQVLLGQRVERRDLVTDSGGECHRLLHLLRLRVLADDVLQHLGVQLDGADRVAHLVGDPERETPYGRHALRHHQLLLGCLQPAERAGELVVQAFDLAACPALPVGDQTQGHRGQPGERRNDHESRPAAPGRNQHRRPSVEPPRHHRGAEPDPGTKVVGVDRDERKEQQVVDADDSSREAQEDEDQEKIDRQGPDEVRAGRAGVDGHQGEDADLVGRETGDDPPEVDIGVGRPQRKETERGQTADHDDRQEYGEDSLVTLQQPKAGIPWFPLDGSRGHLFADYSIAADQGRWLRRRAAIATHTAIATRAARPSHRSTRCTSAKICWIWSAKRNARKKPKGTLTSAAAASTVRNFQNGTWAIPAVRNAAALKPITWRAVNTVLTPWLLYPSLSCSSRAGLRTQRTGHQPRTVSPQWCPTQYRTTSPELTPTKQTGSATHHRKTA